MLHSFVRWARFLATRLAVAVAAAAMLSTPVWAAAYVDSALSDLTPEQKAVVASPQPVQLLFQFKTKGAPNARATKLLKKQVTEIVQASGAFVEVTETPAAGGAVLSVTLDNIPQEGAAGKGFATGLTLGLAGTVVTDYYVCTAEYLPPAGEKITKTANHALHTTLGLKSAPPNGVKAKNINEAVTTMTRQIVSHAVNAVAADPAFAGAPAAPAPAIETPEAAPPEAAPVEGAPPEAAPQEAPAAEPVA